jgi:hypothetical protein
MRIHLVVLLAYLLLAIVLTWPTVAHIATHLPGDGGDDPAIAWNLWWVKHALLTLHANPLYTDYMFYPIGINLAFYTLTTLNALTAMPLTLALGVVPASNLHMWFTVVVGGYGMFLLARYAMARDATRGESQIRREQGDGTPWAAAVAGVLYACASSQIFYISLGQFNIASNHWLPYVILFVLKSRHDLRALRWPALAALFLVMQAWAEMTYASFALVFIALFTVYEAMGLLCGMSRQMSNTKWQMANGGSRKLAWLVARNLVVIVALFVVGIAPLLAAMLPDMRVEGDFWVQGSGFAETFSADLFGFLVPTMHHPLLGGLVRQTGIIAFDKGQHIYLGITLLVLAAIGVACRRRSPGTLFWLVSAVFFAWLALGPTIRINGTDTHIPGPFTLLQSVPFIKGNRYPSRYSVLLVLSLAMLAAPGVLFATRKAGQWWKVGPTLLKPAVWVSLALIALFLFEHLSVPLPQSDMRVPAPYYSIARQSGGTLLDIPVAWRNGFRITGPIDPGFMFGQFYQTVHARPLLQGNTSRNPEFKFQYFTEAPVLNSILALETGHTLPPGCLEADRVLAGEVLRFFDIRTIVVRRGPGAQVNPGAVPETTVPYIEATMPVERAYSDDALTMYHVHLPPLPEVIQVEPAAPLSRLYLGEGWGPVVDRQAGVEQLMWAQRKSVRLLVPLQDRAQHIIWRMYVPGDGQYMTIRLNGWQSATIPLQQGWGEHEQAIPPEAVHSGLNDIWLDFDQLYSASALREALVVQSAGQEVGDFGHIYVNGVDVSSNERGYNVAVLAPGGSVKVAAFDTHLDVGASQRLAEFIAAVPEGVTVAVAAADEASMKLGEEGVAALRSIGATGDLRGKFRWSHAIIGVKGGAPASALEVMDGLRPVAVASGPAVTQPFVAAGVAWLHFKTEE